MNSCRQTHASEMQSVLLQNESEKKDLLLRRSSEIDEQKSALLRRAMIAESGLVSYTYFNYS